MAKPMIPLDYRSSIAPVIRRKLPIWAWSLVTAASLLDVVALCIGLSQGGWGWAFSAGLIFAITGIAVVLACIGAILASVAMVRQKEPKAAIGVALVMSVIAGISAMLLTYFSFQAAASI